MANVTYIFTSGRMSKINNRDYSEDFFYGCRHLINKGFNVNIIEFNNINKFLKKFEYYLSKFFSLPLYFFSIFSLKNIKLIKNSNNVIMISESTGFATLPLLILLKKKYKIKTHLFAMGLYSKKINYKALEKAHYVLINLLEKFVDKIYFLGSEEYKIAISRNYSKSNKYFFKPFCIDDKFWISNKNSDKRKKYILFIGNDSNRDFELLEKIVKSIPNQKFKLVSNNEVVLNFKYDNVSIVKGDWKESLISDSDLRKVYELANLVILPLKESNQPSGQSVSLQAMAAGIPVAITRTKGFWEKEKYYHNENIFFLEPSNLDEWLNLIQNVIKDQKLLDKLALNSKQLILENYSIDKLNTFLIKELE